MNISLDSLERSYLERVAHRRARPTRRQKAQALLALDAGKSAEDVAQLVGILKRDVAELAARFAKQGLAGVGLDPKSHSTSPEDTSRTAPLSAPDNETSHRHLTERKPAADVEVPTGLIEKLPRVCGGAARIVGTRIPVWQLVVARNLGATEAQLLLDFPRLGAEELVAAWEYARAHPAEIAAEIHRDEVA